MKKQLKYFYVLFLIFLTFSCAERSTRVTTGSTTDVVPDIARRLGKFPLTVIDYNRGLLNEEEKAVLAKLIEASRQLEDIFRRQVSEKNPSLRADLARKAGNSVLHKQALAYFDIMKGRWDRLVEDEPFLAPFGEPGKKPAGAGFYPFDMTKEEFERWIAAHPEDKEKFQGLFTVIRREGDKLVAIPYSQYYRESLVPTAEKMREAAAMTSNASLRNFLVKRAEAFFTDDYHESDIAWMDLDSPIEVVIGPYEVYEDAMFNYKTAFEAYVTVVDKPESEKLKAYAQHLPDMERNLPIPDIHKNFSRGTDSPIRVVQEVFTAGHARSGIQTSAFNLPNDEGVRQAKGSKNVLLKNVMEAKFRQSGKPIAVRVLDPSQVSMLSFDAYFNQTLFHELSHGLGPGVIVGPNGEKGENRIFLKELYSTIEETKADVVGAWNLLYAIDKKLVTSFDAKTLFVTDSGLMFRSMRFGISEAHGRGTAVQWNWHREKGAIERTADGRYVVVFDKMKGAIESLANELLMIEATGDYDRANRLLNNYGKTTPEIEAMIASLDDIPVDIAPVFVAAGEK